MRCPLCALLDTKASQGSRRAAPFFLPIDLAMLWQALTPTSYEYFFFFSVKIKTFPVKKTKILPVKKNVPVKKMEKMPVKIKNCEIFFLKICPLEKKMLKNDLCEKNQIFARDNDFLPVKKP